MTTAAEAAQNFHWFALRVPPQKEQVAQVILRRKGLATFLPVHREWRRRNKYTKVKELRTYPLMPRYVFTGFSKRVPMWFDVFNLPLITGVVGIGGRPMKLDQDGMERIMGLYQNAIDAPKEQKWMETHKEFSEGDTVQILGGSFDGLVVPVLGIDGPNAKVLISLFGGERSVNIAVDQLVAA